MFGWPVRVHAAVAEAGNGCIASEIMQASEKSITLFMMIVSFNSVLLVCSYYKGNFPVTSIDKGMFISPTWGRKTRLRTFRTPLQPD